MRVVDLGSVVYILDQCVRVDVIWRTVRLGVLRHAVLPSPSLATKRVCEGQEYRGG